MDFIYFGAGFAFLCIGILALSVCCLIVVNARMDYEEHKKKFEVPK